MSKQAAAGPLGGSAAHVGGRPEAQSTVHATAHAMPPSAWPIWFAASSGVAFIGLALAEPTLVVGGLALVAAASVGWGLAAAAEWRARAEASHLAASTPGGHGSGRAFAGTFIAVVGASVLAALVVTAQPSQGTAVPGPSAAPSGSPSPGAGPTINLVARNVSFATTSLTAPANTPFTIAFDNEDPSVPHNVQIKDAGGSSVFRGEIVTGPVQIAYQIPALAPGTYTFVCDVHPTTMTGTLTVK